MRSAYIGIFKGRMTGEIRENLELSRDGAIIRLQMFANYPNHPGKDYSADDSHIVAPNKFGDFEIFDLVGFVHRTFADEAPMSEARKENHEAR